MRNPPDEALGATDDLPSSPPASGRGPKGGRPSSAKNKGASGREPNPSRMREGDEDAPIRKCILSGERDVRPHLVRLALAPDGQIHPDVRARLLAVARGSG